MSDQKLFKEFEEQGMPLPDAYLDFDTEGQMIIVFREDDKDGN
jgi:hypothetical protein